MPVWPPDPETLAALDVLVAHAEDHIEDARAYPALLLAVRALIAIIRKLLNSR